MDPDHRPAHSCKHCQRIVLPYEKFVGDNHTVKLPHSGPEIRSAVEDGCELFRLFFARGTNTCFEGRSALSEFVTSKIGRPRRFRTICWKIAKFRALRKAQKWDGSFYIDIVTVKYDTLPSWGWALAFRYQQWTNYWTPTILKASPGTSADELPDSVMRAQNSLVASESSLRQAREWLSTCYSDHVKCPKSPGDFVPTRLLQIEHDDGKVFARLIDAFSEAHTKWAALSYVWGGDQGFKTTVSSLSTMREPFSIEKLPRTLRDAVNVCRGLGLDYIWIDCLCVIQDDADDLAQELAIMPQIYQQAWVTISASTANNVSEGFVHDRGYKVVKSKTPISLTYRAKDSVNTGAIIIAEAENAGTGRQTALPIHDRAWTYQERRLSPRLLDFTNRNLTFICRTGSFCQGNGSTLWDSQSTNEWDWLGQQYIIPCLESQDLPEWHVIVKNYAPRKLTFPGDKLKAIAALADLYKTRTKQTYIAGLWRETLVQDLCWVVNTPFLRGPRSCLMPRPFEYRAPTWSWAAIDLQEHLHFGFAENNLRWSFKERCEMIADAKVLDVALEQEPPNTTYGQIHSGHLTLQGLALTTTWFYNQKPGLTLNADQVNTSRDAVESGWADDYDAHAEVTVLLLTKGESTYHKIEHFIFGLLLVEVAPRIYQRVGTFHSSVSGRVNVDSIDTGQIVKGFRRQTFTII